MYERSAIVLERYFKKVFGFDKEINLKTNYEHYKLFIDGLKKYQDIVNEEEKIIEKFDEVASEIEEIQNEHARIYELNLELEKQRNQLFNDLGENPNTLDKKLQKIEENIEQNNNKLKQLREKYVESLVIFTQRQKERNKYSRIRRTAESDYIKNTETLKAMFEKISKNNVQKIKNFINLNKELNQKEIIQIMLENGKNEKVVFNSKAIEKVVKIRTNIAQKEAELYINIYDRTKRTLDELANEIIKTNKAEKMLRDVSVKLAFLDAIKDYLTGFLDNERMTAINGKAAHEKLMEEAVKNFDTDMIQISNLYELIMKETMSKSTKKAYKELYNKNYLKDIEEKERNFQQEVTNIRINMGTVINSNYWRIEGIKNIYMVFQEQITEKFNKDLSEYKIDDVEEVTVKESKNQNRESDENIDYREDEDTRTSRNNKIYNDNEYNNKEKKDSDNYKKYVGDSDDYEEDEDYEDDSDDYEEEDYEDDSDNYEEDEDYEDDSDDYEEDEDYEDDSDDYEENEDYEDDSDDYKEDEDYEDDSDDYDEEDYYENDIEDYEEDSHNDIKNNKYKEKLKYNIRKNRKNNRHTKTNKNHNKLHNNYKKYFENDEEDIYLFEYEENGTNEKKDNKLFEDKIEKIIKNSRNKSNNKKKQNKEKGILGKLFKK